MSRPMNSDLAAQAWFRQAKTSREAQSSATNGADDAWRRQEKQMGRDFSDGPLAPSRVRRGMTFHRSSLRFIVAAALAAASVAAQQTPARLDFRITKGATPFRPAIREFIRSVQRELHYSLGIPCPAPQSPDLLVEIGFARPFALASGHSLLRSPSGKIRPVVCIPDACVTDWNALRFDIVAAIFRAELHSRAVRGAPVTEPPVWFVRGLARLTDSAGRGDSFEHAYGQWAHARLDAAQWLFRAESRADRLPDVAAQLVAWCVDQPDRSQRWSALLDALAAGEAWTSALIARVFADSDDIKALGTSFDIWMASRARRIFSPGTTSGGTLARARLLLLVFPGELDWNPNSGFDGKAFLPLSWYAANSGLPNVAALLHRRASAFRRAAIGHDSDFRLLCSLYAKALDTAAERGWRHASADWLAAEELRTDLETRVSAGETLGAVK